MDHAGRTAVWLAREAATRYLAENVTIEPPADLAPALTERAGVFVTIRQGNLLRGCVGTLAPTKFTVAHEIIANSIATATSDPRFAAIRFDELPGLNFEVDRLSALEPVLNASLLDPLTHGVVVEAGNFRGVLLPAIEGVDTVEQQIEIARAKAGIPLGTPFVLHRFTVTRYREGFLDRGWPLG